MTSPIPFYRGTILLALLAAPAALASDPQAPPAAVKAVTDTYQGVSVSDPYRWLEDPTDPAVQKWSDSQNQRTRGYLDALPSRAAIKDELSKLIFATSPSYYGLQRAGPSLFAMYNQPPKQQPMLAVTPAAPGWWSIPTP